MVLLFHIFAFSDAMCPYSTLTDDNRNEFLSAQNSYRSQVALGTFVAQGYTKPPATNMQSLTWDCNLESMAQTYANSCPTHSPGPGQNLYTTVSATPPTAQGCGTDCADNWAGQFQQNGWPSSMFSASDNTGFGSQMCWATTTNVGCGFASCSSPDYRNPYRTVAVCNYSPPGNTPGAPVYQEGTTCSDCTNGYDSTTGLCYPAAAPPAPPVYQPAAPVYPPAAQPPVYPPNNVPVYPPVNNPPVYPPWTDNGDDERDDDHGENRNKHGKKPKNKGRGRGGRHDD